MPAIEITNLRCFKNFKFQVPNLNFIILDQNGSGKTTILSAIYSLYSGQPFPGTKFTNYLKLEEQYFGISTEDKLCFLNGKISTSGRITTKWESNLVGINKHIKSNIKENQTLSYLTYQPTDNLWLFQNRNSKLNTLDTIIAQTNPGYLKLIQDLDKLTKSKLKLIKHTNKTVFNQNSSLEVVTDWSTVNLLSDQIFQKSTLIWQSRLAFLQLWQTSLPKFADLIQNPIFEWSINWEIWNQNGKKINLKEISQLDISKIINKLEINIHDLKSLWYKECITEKILFGAQRDDFGITGYRQPIQNILSRGEMRLFVIFTKKLGSSPESTLWFLDDIFNELDDQREQSMLDQIFRDSAWLICTGTRCNLKNLPSYLVSDLAV